jgi:hypothetical protein
MVSNSSGTPAQPKSWFKPRKTVDTSASPTSGTRNDPAAAAIGLLEPARPRLHVGWLGLAVGAEDEMLMADPHDLPSSLGLGLSDTSLITASMKERKPASIRSQQSSHWKS